VSIERVMAPIQALAADMDTAHAALDAYKVPQRDTLAERVRWLCDVCDAFVRRDAQEGR